MLARRLKTISSIVFALLIQACNSQSEDVGQANIAFKNQSLLALTPPDFLLANRTVNKEQLAVDVVLSYTVLGQQYQSASQANYSGANQTSTWHTTSNVPANTPFTLSMTWFESEPRLDLVRITRDFDGFSQSGSTAFNYDFAPDATFSDSPTDNDYAGFDYDEDGLSNLTERNPPATDPFVRNVPDDSDPINDPSDPDNDQVDTEFDNCPSIANFDQYDFDSDGVGDACDNDDDNDGVDDPADCQPFDGNIHPGALELLDAIDNNCDDFVDNVLTDATGLIATATANSATSIYYAGAVQASTPGFTLTERGSLQVGPRVVINGGSLNLPLEANRAFSYVLISSEEGEFHKIDVPSNDLIDLIVSFNTLVIGGETEDFSIRVGYPEGVVSEPLYISVTTIQVGVGELQVSLSWNDPADIDLHLIEPDGTRINYSNKESASGGRLDLDSYAVCSITESKTENITYETVFPPNGTYNAIPRIYSRCGITTPISYVLTVRIRDEFIISEGVFPVDSSPAAQQGETVVFEINNSPLLY